MGRNLRRALSPFWARRIKMPLGTEVNLGPGDVVLEGIATPPKRGTARLFSAHVYCGQTAGWMNTPLDTEVDLGSDHIVLDGDPALPPCERGTAAPLFSAHDYCGHGHPYQLMLSFCSNFYLIWCVGRPRPDISHQYDFDPFQGQDQGH